MQNRPETAAVACLQLVKEFPINPEASGKKLAAIGREHGYHVIVPSVNTLWDSCHKQTEREIISFLRQPEWIWRFVGGVPDRCVAGIIVKEKFIPVGYYLIGAKENGVFNTLDLENGGAGLTFEPGDVPDPRPKVKPRLYCKNRKYYLAIVGKISELIRAGYDRAQIILTNNRGYFKKHEAYVVQSGPLSIDKARDEKISHYVAPSVKKV